MKPVAIPRERAEALPPAPSPAVLLLQAAALLPASPSGRIVVVTGEEASLMAAAVARHATAPGGLCPGGALWVAGSSGGGAEGDVHRMLGMLAEAHPQV